MVFHSIDPSSHYPRISFAPRFSFLQDQNRECLCNDPKVQLTRLYSVKYYINAQLTEKDGKNTGTVRSPTSQAATSDIKASSTSEKVKGKNEDKKEKKRRKREREDATMLQKILAPLILELRDVTWTKWIVHGKPSNPFIQVPLCYFNAHKCDV